ncbi:posphoenolpyruvate synthetase regulatory kinase/phosphorylase PpsR [Zooshikella sp. RANM57]|uniref:posphoenolpyruvate synthetase regulatory kinase/phosphorylase PpsR n=1 Tax=Zooshikella sp. RANM57 TaxID=3425863 RepID=UPI003D6FF9F9
MVKRCVFFISDGTGITAETLGHSLLTQFNRDQFSYKTFPYIDTVEKAQQTVKQIKQYAFQAEQRPLIFSTIVNEAVTQELSSLDAFVIDCFSAFLTPLEQELQQPSNHSIGQNRVIAADPRYHQRITAVHFALDFDDGAKTYAYDQADVILIGVSRCGKTPTCLYLALQYGINAANYPLTEEDLDNQRLPGILLSHKDRLFGLTIDAERLAAIRHERRPESRYASIKQCRQEVNEVEALMQEAHVPFINTTQFSIEEIATRVLSLTGIQRQF